MYLKPGDSIALVSPSRAISRISLDPAISWIESKGFKVLLGRHALNVDRQFAGTDLQRQADIREFIENPEVKAIWSTRGGYGGVRIVDHIDFSPLIHQHKWLIGYSDFTVFHSHLHKLGIPSIHATMPVNMSRNPSPEEMQSNDSLLKALIGDDLEYVLESHPLNRKGDCRGILIGGNLSILYSLSASASDIDTENKILFIEDLDEYLYHIDRMMMNLKRSGKLAKLKGLIVGGMSEMRDNTIPYGLSAEEIIFEHVREYDFPVYFGFGAGHVQPNYALRFGKEMIIKDNRLILPA